MSGENYGYIRILSPEELDRMEAERRKKEAEQRLLIEEEKTKVVLERMKREKEKRKEEEMKEQRTRQEEEKRWTLEKKLLEDKITIKKDTVDKGSSQEIEKSKEKEAEVLSKLQSIELEISNLNPLISELIKTDLLDIKNSLNKIKEKISGNYAYFENVLKWLHIRLKESVKKGEDKLESMEKEFDVLSKKVVELLTDIEIITTSPLLPDKDKALDLKTALENALLDRNINKIKGVIITITSELKTLYNQYLEIEKLNDERQYIIENVQNILTEMGYNVSRFPYQTSKNPQAPLHTEFNIPGGEAVRLGFSTDKSLFAEVFHPESEKLTNKSDFKKQEKKWCEDYSIMLEKLKNKGFVCQEKWRRDFTDGEIEEMIGKTEEVSVASEEEYRRRIIEEQRRMRK